MQSGVRLFGCRAGDAPITLLGRLEGEGAWVTRGVYAFFSPEANKNFPSRSLYVVKYNKKILQ